MRDLDVFIGIRVPRSLHKALMSTALSQGLSLSEYTRQALSKCILSDFLEHSKSERAMREEPVQHTSV